MEKEKQVAGDNRTDDFQGFVLDDSPKTVEEQLEIIKKMLLKNGKKEIFVAYMIWQLAQERLLLLFIQ